MRNRELGRSDPPNTPALGASRARVLRALQTAGGPLDVLTVAEQVGLHANTTRFHLDGLVHAGLAMRSDEERETPGRPRALYAAAADSGNGGARSYRLLAEILASYVASQTRHPAEAATRAGEAWGRYLAETPMPFGRPTAAAATNSLVQTLDDLGFEPEAVANVRKRQILLHHCPFREAAEQNREVVCSVHLGLMRGVLAELGAPVVAERLEPFVEPHLCVTHLRSRTQRAAS